MNGIIDLHCDTLLNCYLEKKGLREYSGHINLEKMKRGGSMAQCFAIFLAESEEFPRTEKDPYVLFHQVAAYYEEQLSANSTLIAAARSAEDVERNFSEGKLSAILTVEDCVHVDGKIERIDEMAQKGVCMASLTWNFENSLGYPNSRDPRLHMLGLKPFGIEAVERMNETGIIVDVAHLSEGGFYDVVRYSKKPFAASHSCARALCNHSRNLTDDQLRVLGEAGGVAGVNFYSRFLTEGSDDTVNRRIAEHAAYIADKAGIESVALGSDFDGIDCSLEMKDYSGYPTLIDELSRRFTDDEIEKIASGNFLRLMRDCGCGR